MGALDARNGAAPLSRRGPTLSGERRAPSIDVPRGGGRSSYYAPGTDPTPVQRPTRRPLLLEYDAEPVPATRPVPIQPAPVQQAPRTLPLPVQRQVVRTAAAEPLVLPRPLPVQRPTEVARVVPAVAPARRPPRAPRGARRAVKRVLKAPTTGPVPIQTTAPRSSRHGFRALVATLGVLGLTAVSGLPAFAASADEPAPPPGAYSDDDVQAYQAGAGIDPSGVGDVGAWDTVVAPTWISPVEGHLGDPFGPRPIQPVAGTSLFHRGQDIAAPCGSPIKAAADGTVVTATWWGTYGNWVLIDNGNGIATGYAHQSRMLVTPGQHVTAGEVIGLVGETGAATGCHLHLEVHLNGVAINPVPFFTAKGVRLGS